MFAVRLLSPLSLLQLRLVSSTMSDPLDTIASGLQSVSLDGSEPGGTFYLITRTPSESRLTPSLISSPLTRPSSGICSS